MNAAEAAEGRVVKRDGPGLSIEKVEKVLLEFNAFRFKPTLYGFDVDGWVGSGAPWRFVHGGGISGDGTRVWWLERKDGSEKSEMVNTLYDLRRIIREWLTDEEKPFDGAYARRNPSRFGRHYVWCWSPKK